MWDTLLKSEGRLLLSFLEKLNFNNSIINKKIKCLNFSQQVMNILCLIRCKSEEKEIIETFLICF